MAIRWPTPAVSSALTPRTPRSNGSITRPRSSRLPGHARQRPFVGGDDRPQAVQRLPQRVDHAAQQPGAHLYHMATRPARPARHLRGRVPAERHQNRTVAPKAHHLGPTSGRRRRRSARPNPPGFPGRSPPSSAVIADQTTDVARPAVGEGRGRGELRASRRDGPSRRRHFVEFGAQALEAHGGAILDPALTVSSRSGPRSAAGRPPGDVQPGLTEHRRVIRCPRSLAGWVARRSKPPPPWRGRSASASISTSPTICADQPVGRLGDQQASGSCSACKFGNVSASAAIASRSAAHLQPRRCGGPPWPRA